MRFISHQNSPDSMCGLTEPLPVGLDLWSQAAYFPLELLFGLFKQVTILGDDFSF